MKNIFYKCGLLLIGLILCVPAIKAQQVIITDAAGFNLTVDGTAEINADLINNSQNALFLGTFNFVGTVEHEIGGSAPVEFVNLTLNNTEGVRLTTDVSVSGAINLLAGTINLLGSNLTIGANASLSGTFSPDVMIIADSTGTLKREIPAMGTYIFPIGDTTGLIDYSPVSLTFNEGTFSNAVVSINLKNEKHPENTSTDNYLNKYWTVSQTGISDFSCDAVFTYSNEDIVGSEAKLWGAKWDGNQWEILNQASLNQFSGTVNSFSEFTAGEKTVLAVNDDLNIEDKVKVFFDGDKIIIRSDNVKLEKAEIYNTNGQLIFSKDLSKNALNELKFNADPNYYIVRLYTGEQFINKKIFKN